MARPDTLPGKGAVAPKAAVPVTLIERSRWTQRGHSCQPLSTGANGRHIGKFGKLSEVGEASKRVIYTLTYLIINSLILALLSDGII